MPYPRRMECESDVYHLMARGVGKMNIFEDDDDYLELLRLLTKSFSTEHIDIYAWCFMSNHVHLLVHGKLASISKAMKGALGTYATFFNGKHGHVGHLFQGRFSSVPILDESQLLAAVSYIHKNPVKAGLATIDGYEWSSYAEYISAPSVTKTLFVLDIIGGVEAFVSMHMQDALEPDYDWQNQSKCARKFTSERMAKDIAIQILGDDVLEELASMDKKARDKALASLRAGGLSVRQIERMTGIGRGIIQRVSLEAK